MDLVPPILRELFIDAIAATSDMYLRSRFATAGLRTDEVLVKSPSPRGGVMETRPVRYRVERYFACIDWTSRAEIRRLLPIVETALAKLEFSPSDTYRMTVRELESLGLGFQDGRIRRQG